MSILRRAVLAIVFVFSTAVTYAQDWEYGIGTGFYAVAFDGDGGLATTVSGPIMYKVDLDAHDTSDLLESAFGFGGYARNGKWTITYSFSQLELEDDVSATLNSVPGNLDLNFTKDEAKMALEYQFAESGGNRWGILGGFRYVSHDWDGNFEESGVSTFSGDTDEDWTDFIIGLTHSYPFSQTLIWSSRLEYGAGGSEGTTFFDTGLTWRFANSWSARLYGAITQHDYEEGNVGDSDYYLYDTEESGVGVTILYNF